MKKILYKMIIFAMTVSLILTNAISVFGSDSQIFKDIYGSEYYADAVSRLSQLSILSGYEDGTFRAYNKVTRAEMAKIVCSILNINAMNNMFSIFDDVSPNHWANGYIICASNYGIVSGDGNGKFRPEDNVLYEEAIKMIVCTLYPYESIEKNSMDWSAPYIRIAQNNGLLNNTEGRKYFAATRGDIAVMIYNGLAKESPNEEFTDNLNEEANQYTEDSEEYFDKPYYNDDYDIEYNDNYDDNNEYRSDFNDTDTLNWIDETKIDIDVFKDEVIDLVNKERQKEGISPLKYNSLLEQTAQQHSEDMVLNNFFDHTNLRGESPFDRMKNNGIDYFSAGENIACGQSSPEEVMESWMNSDGHRKNILNASYNQIGVGIAINEYGVIYWTQNFIGK